MICTAQISQEIVGSLRRATEVSGASVSGVRRGFQGIDSGSSRALFDSELVQASRGRASRWLWSRA